jgi:FkbM family methyltransferase
MTKQIMLQKIYKQIKKQIKNAAFQLTGRFSHLKIGIKCNHIWYGNDYGGFYVCPDLLNKESVVYSFGIGEDISFDKAIIDKHNCNVHGFDPTPKSIKWVSSQNQIPNFHFYAYGLDSKSGAVDFFMPFNDNHVSGSLVIQNNVSEQKKVIVEMKSLFDITNSLKHNHIDIVKMDIEGSEYEVLDSIFEANISINQFLVEFHERFFENGKEKSIQFINRMKKHGFEIFAISDSYEELSFINKKFCS